MRVERQSSHCPVRPAHVASLRIHSAKTFASALHFSSLSWFLRLKSETGSARHTNNALSPSTSLSQVLRPQTVSVLPFGRRACPVGDALLITIDPVDGVGEVELAAPVPGISDRQCEKCPLGFVDHDSAPLTPCFECNVGGQEAKQQGLVGECPLCTAGTVDSDLNSATPCEECEAGVDFQDEMGKTVCKV